MRKWQMTSYPASILKLLLLNYAIKSQVKRIFTKSSPYLGFIKVSLPEVQSSYVVVDFWWNFNTDVVL